MSKQIVITEKSSQAKNVREAVGNRYGQVMPAQGHLVELQEPADVNEDWKRWSTALLRPDGLYGLKPARDKRRAQMLKGIKDALKNTEMVWIATDCDREGQLIGQEILEFCKFRGKVMRVMFAAEDTETITEAFAQAKPNETYRSLYEAGVARQQADQIYNLSLTRAATVTLAPDGNGPVGVGRVKTPTLAIAAKRELEIRNFVPVTYYEVEADTRSEHGMFKTKYAPKARMTDRAQADTVASKANGFKGPIQVTVSDKKERPPQLHSLPSLQKTCAQKFGWTAKHTADTAQELYSGEGKKITTYPRTEVRHLPANATQFVGPIVQGLRQIEEYAAVPAPEPPTIRTGAKGTFSDKGLGQPGQGSHHAIVPNVKTVANMATIWTRLSDDERKMFDIIARSYIASVMPDYEYKQTNVSLDVEGYTFKASGRQPTKVGWKAIYAREETEGSGNEENQNLPRLTNGEDGQITQAKTIGKETKPPPRYNEGTLIEAMKNAWKWVKDEQERETLKETEGIGTGVTRSEVIEGLKRQGFFVTKGKQIFPSDSGMKLYEVLDKADPQVVDPGTTARFERTLGSVVEKTVTMKDAIDAVSENAQRIIGRIAQSGARLEMNTNAAVRAPTPAMKKLAKTIAERKDIKLPKGAMTSGTICKAFLDEHAGGNGGGGAGREPSEKQKQFAGKIAQDSGIEIPIEAQESARALSKWIDAHKPKGTIKAPSDKQIAFANSIAKRTNKTTPKEAMNDGAKLSKWIDQNK